MRDEITEEFIELFNEGVDYYINGDWKKAWEKFNLTIDYLETREDDRPSKVLLDFMESENNEVPENWSGYWILDD